ncbi:MAG: serine/threonine-protein kinase, partial [Anaerolineae bacterium]
MNGAVSKLDTRKIELKRTQSSLQAEGTLPPQTVLQERYKVLAVQGVGGMGAVYRARDLRFSAVTKIVAVKEMSNIAPDPRLREIGIQNFEREANILASLSHPAIPKIFDYFTEGSRSYLILEFIEGQSLEKLLEERQQLLSQERIVDWALQVCDVLMYLHSHQPPVIFRDMKPGNLMLRSEGRIMVIDFGIAKVFEHGQRGTMIGTEGYSPPEQYRGVAEPRGDLYALGATLHHLLTGRDPRLEPPFT